MMSSVLGMGDTDPSQVLALTLDLNTSPHESAAGVLQTLSLISRADLGITGYLRVLNGTSACNFTFTRVDEILPSHNAEGSRNYFEGVTLIPENDMQKSVKAEVTESLRYGTSETSTPVDEDSESTSPDTPTLKPRKTRRNRLHHPEVSNESYKETDPSDNNDKTSTIKKHNLRKNRPAKGALAEPPPDLADLLDPKKVNFACVSPANPALQTRTRGQQAQHGELSEERRVTRSGGKAIGRRVGGLTVPRKTRTLATSLKSFKPQPQSTTRYPSVLMELPCSNMPDILNQSKAAEGIIRRDFEQDQHCVSQ